MIGDRTDPVPEGRQRHMKDRRGANRGLVTQWKAMHCREVTGSKSWDSDVFCEGIWGLRRSEHEDLGASGNRAEKATVL